MRPMLYDFGEVTPATVAAETEAALAEADLLIQAAIDSAESPTFETTMRPLDLAWGRAAEAYGRGAFLGQVSTDAAVRDAGQAADERLTKWRVGLPFRTDLYRALAAFAASDEAASLTGERRHLLEIWMRDFRR